jgi:hypothetical protein
MKPIAKLSVMVKALAHGGGVSCRRRNRIDRKAYRLPNPVPLATETPMQRMLATAADAEIILKLYELRTEAVMRQARAWVGGEFWPQTVDEFYAVYENPRDPHNPWLRQVLTYWEMGAAMVLHGAVSAELFVDCNGEGFFLMAKFAHLLEAIREKNPTFFNKTTEMIKRFSAAAQRYEATLKRVEATRSARAAK